MNLLVINRDSEIYDLMASTGQKMILTVGGLYLAGHVIATLGFPQLFIPRIWGLSIYFFALMGVSLFFVTRRYLLAQGIWLVGLAGAVALAYSIFREPAIILLYMFLPLMAMAAVGLPGTALTILLVLVVSELFGAAGLIPMSFVGFIFVGGLAVSVFGWSLSSNLFGALDAASFHYGEARRLLKESQEHQLEIARILKDREQVNYQLQRTNEMLRFARSQADEARENRNRFMLAVSHELRSPLNFIIGFSDLMVNDPETYAPLPVWPAGLYDDIQEVYQSSQHLMRLINDILDMGKIDASQMSLYREKVQIEQIVLDVRDMLQPAFEKKNLTLTIELPSDLPPVYVDTTRIRQVLLNLLNNGLRYTDRGGVTLLVRKEEEHLRISVTDTGTGIAREDLPKVFEEFRQVGEENWRRHAGSGLGLFISRQFVELHGGSMAVESTLGQGTRFTFTIPLSSAPAESLFHEAGEAAPATRNNPPILLVSANGSEAKTLQQALNGYEVFPVANLEIAKDKLRELFPRAILAAVEAGSLELEKIPYDLPVVRFNLSRPVSQMENLRTHLVKPVARHALLQAIGALGPQVHNLLIVDDDPAMVRFIRQSFRAGDQGEPAADYNLMGAFSGAEAFEILQRQPVDAVLLDLELPDMHGWDWMARLHSLPGVASLPVIVISAQDVPQNNFVPGTNVLEVALRRPLTINELGSVVKSVLENILPQYPGESPAR